MGHWEQRGNGKSRYYFRSQRVGKRVRKVYLGSGEAAKLAAEEDAVSRAQRIADQMAVGELKATLAQADQVTAELRHGAELLAEATLIGMGFHQHRGQWRLRRG